MFPVLDLIINVSAELRFTVSTILSTSYICHEVNDTVVNVNIKTPAMRCIQKREDRDKTGS